jgi:hypothetical protein
MESEMTVIPYVSHGLEAIKTRDIATIPPPANPLEHGELEVSRLKQLIEAQES